MKNVLLCAVLVFSILIAPQTSQAQQTDYRCMNDCRSAGYQYRFCQSRCSYGDNDLGGFMGGGNGSGGILPDRRRMGSQTDYSCMRDCANLGYQYGYCKELCSY